MPPAEAGLLSVEPVKNARALLRYSLPIINDKIRDIQVSTPCDSHALANITVISDRPALQ